MENTIEKKIDDLFGSPYQVKVDDPKVKLQKLNEILKLKKELKNFNYTVIEQYKYNKYNFYNFFNFYYLFRLKDDIKNSKNDLLRMFFSVHSFKKWFHELFYLLENKKKIWLLKHIIKYKKNKIKEEKIEMRQKKYNFSTLNELFKDEGFDESIVNKMNEIIMEVREKEYFKEKIFIFMIRAIDIFKNDPQKFIKQLDIILQQVK